MMLSKTYLVHAYLKEKKSARQIANGCHCSENKVTYWLKKHGIQKRSISEAIYIQANPTGDPFTTSPPCEKREWFLYGLGLGLFWGEGNKMNKSSVRLGNADPALIKMFVRFLTDIYGIDQKKLRFGLQIFSDVNPVQALDFWTRQLNVSKHSFYKVIVTPSVKSGSYRKKNPYGVVTVYFSNTKLRAIIGSAIERLQHGEVPS